jgi:hypothetical protein
MTIFAKAAGDSKRSRIEKPQIECQKSNHPRPVRGRIAPNMVGNSALRRTRQRIEGAMANMIAERTPSLVQSAGGVSDADFAAPLTGDAPRAANGPTPSSRIFANRVAAGFPDLFLGLLDILQAV